MITTFATQTLVSTHLWLNNYLQQDGQAYINTASRLFYTPDPALDPAYVGYNAPFKSFVYDSGVSGAQIITSVSGSVNLSRGQSGMKIDYNNGRVLLPAAVGTNAVISGSYAFTELNVYKANETQEKTVFTNKYYLNSRFARPMTGIPPPNSYVTPCVFILNIREENVPFALGGLYNTQMVINLCIMAENYSQLEGSLSLLADAKDAVYPQVPVSVWPLNEYGDWKYGGYNYQTVIDIYGPNLSNLYTIDNVVTSKVGDGVKIDENIFIGLVDLYVSQNRMIR